jgi:chemotaxis signal transduction protein
MGEEHYAVSVADILEVAHLGDITPLPGAPRPFLGIRSLRGEVLPIIDLADLLDVREAGKPERIVVAQSGALRAGLAVETVMGVDDLPDADVATDSVHLKGATLHDDELIGVIDIPAVLAGIADQGPR